MAAHHTAPDHFSTSPQVHGDELLHFPALLPYMERISEAHRGAWTHLDGLFQHALCLVSFFKSSVIA